MNKAVAILSKITHRALSPLCWLPLAFMTSVVFSSAAHATEAGDSANIWTTILYLVLTVGGGGLSTLVGWLIKKLINWLDGKIENEWLSGVMQRLKPVAGEFVDGMYRSSVKPLKEAGGWTAASQAATKDSVKEYLKSWVGARGVGRAAKILGAEGKFESMIGGLVEDTITERKIVGRQASALKAATNP